MAGASARKVAPKRNPTAARLGLLKKEDCLRPPWPDLMLAGGPRLIPPRKAFEFGAPFAGFDRIRACPHGMVAGQRSPLILAPTCNSH